MSFSTSFVARDVHTARRKLHEAHMPAAVKALVELALAGIPVGGGAGAGVVGYCTADEAKQAVNVPAPRPPRLCCILVEAHGHIDESGGRSNIGLFRVEPYYD
jgi:hypothetical protein